MWEFDKKMGKSSFRFIIKSGLTLVILKNVLRDLRIIKWMQKIDVWLKIIVWGQSSIIRIRNWTALI